MKTFRTVAILIVCLASLTTKSLQAQSTEERFQDVFVTAGYATAFGAALGAACLSFLDDPQDNLKYVAIGASLGFIGGSILGSYVVLSPGIVQNDKNTQILTASPSKTNTITLSPIFSTASNSISSVQGSFTLASW